MNVVRCDNGHFYDADVYADCPHCTAKDRAEDAPQKRGGLFAKRRKAKETEKRPEEKAVAAPERLCPPTELLLPAQKEETVRTEKEESFPATAEQNETEAAARKRGYVVPEVRADISVPEVRPARTDTVVPERTVGVFCETPEENPPCVGWLVGLSGPYRGVSMELKPGGNTIGRGEGHRINLFSDNRVSRETHAYLVYEPRERKYYMDSGRNSGLSYVNGEVILHRTVLSAGDEIEIGGGKYLFVPLCSDTFSWERLPAFRPICREGA